VLWWGDAQTGRAIARKLADQSGPLIPLITGQPDQAHVMAERHVCIDTTAAGGNAALLAG
jgi:RHH-type proline utilization regulon transcriptional repressor/proline dehydrogenase/delta 1-pyrroline-5-carboxylate dehydrogenase